MSEAGADPVAVWMTEFPELAAGAVTEDITHGVSFRLRWADLAVRPVRLLGGDHFHPMLLLEAALDCLAGLSLHGHLDRVPLAAHLNRDCGGALHVRCPLF